jgi:hypothetical protein
VAQPDAPFELRAKHENADAEVDTIETIAKPTRTAEALRVIMIYLHHFRMATAKLENSSRTANNVA